MQFFKAAYWATGATKDIPYAIGDQYSSAWGSWVHHKGTAKENGDPVSVFVLNGSDAQDAKLIAGRNGAKRLRTVRHPNILSFLFSTEIEKEEGGVTKPTLYIVTEPVMPLAEKIKELNLDGTQRDEYYAWGLHQIAKAVSFLNNDCKLVHGNISVSAVVVTPALDWKLHALDVMAEFDGGNADAQGPMLQYDWLIGTQYKPLEVAKNDWAAVRKGPPHAIDSWGLGCLIQELFSEKKLAKTEDLRSTGPIPKTLLPDYQRLLGSQPNRRMNSSKLINNSEYFQNKLVDTIQFMEVLNLKDSNEKDTFFRKLPTLAAQLPRQIVLMKLLPQMASALEFGSAPALALNPLLKFGSWLPQEDFSAKILPTLVKLFASPDRAMRIALLQSLDSFAPALSASTVDEQVFGHLAAGFSDASAFVRELTLKSMLTLVPKLSQRTLTGSLLKFLSKLQVDEEAGIRTNTTILLGNIARHLSDATRKRVLINAFTVRALRDAFPPARSAGIMALMATEEYYETLEVGTRILPPLVLLTVDPDPDVRAKAFQGSDLFLKRVKRHYDQLQAQSGDDTSASALAGDAGPSASSAVSSGLLGWAVNSFTTSAAKPVPAAGTVPPSTSATPAVNSAVEPRPAAEVAVPQAPAHQEIWGKEKLPAGEAVDEDKDGWDELEEDEDEILKPPSPPPVVPRVSTVQREQFRPAPSAVVPKKEGRETGEEEEEEEEESWSAMAAPQKPAPGPKISLSGAKKAASKPAVKPAVKPGLGASKAQGHVQLKKSADLSLEDMLGNSMPGGPAGRGRGRGALRLGAQRLSK